ncbi:hypothetical protein [Paenibacillus sp. FJAT-27812]|uniref:hypothetical protein n=1 Tax=Paenibacillus sp. FJAT-27812 TaxID=1684143 RepID=UPI0006A7E4F9|nr:hypothetical protein [Paenibacillus sp. FJAT-27812]
MGKPPFNHSDNRRTQKLRENIFTQREIPIKPLLENAFQQVKYKLVYHDDMDAWLKSHIVPIVALSSVSFLFDGDLKKASKDKALLKQAISVMDEGFHILEKLGYTITPANQASFIR